MAVVAAFLAAFALTGQPCYASSHEYHSSQNCYLFAVFLVGPNMHGDSEANQPEPDSDAPKWYTTFEHPDGMLVIVGLITCVIIGWQSWQTRKAAEATQEAVRDGKKEYMLAEDTTKRQLRAYICMDTAEVEFSTGQPIANVHFKNCGQTPAYEVHGWVGVEVRPHPLQSPLPVRDDIAKPKTTVGPGVGFGYPGRRKSQMFTKEELSKIGAGPLTTFYVYGRVDYRDAFGGYWYTTVRLIAGGEAGLRVSTLTDGSIRWSLCPDIEGNDAT